MNLAGAAGTWSETTIAGHTADLYEPPHASEHGYVVLYLHGVHLTRLKDNAAYCREFDRHGLSVIAPLTQRSWWSDRICPEFDAQVSAERFALEPVLRFIERRWNAAPPGIALLGTSMGGQGGLRLAFRHPRTFPIVAAVSPAIDFQMRLDEGDEVLAQMYADAEDARQDTATLHVHPLNWPRQIWFCCDPADQRWFESADKLRMKLAALGIPHQCDLETSAGGHGWQYYDHMAGAALEFIARSLEQERLRAD